MTIGHHIDQALKAHIYAILNVHKQGQPLPEPLDCYTDSFGEVIEKNAILHIRAWHLEDTIGSSYGDDAALAASKKKLDQLWKVKRPAQVAAINRMANEAILLGRSLTEESVKMYKGFEG